MKPVLQPRGERLDGSLAGVASTCARYLGEARGERRPFETAAATAPEGSVRDLPEHVEAQRAVRNGMARTRRIATSGPDRH